MQLYGIPNCDTVKRARAWLAQAGAQVTFVDFKKTPPTLAQLQAWAAHADGDKLLNRSGSTWRKLDAAAQAAASTAAGALALMQAQPSVIKRPVVDWGDGRITVGFSPERFAALLTGGDA